jgi:hypothetical protein
MASIQQSLWGCDIVEADDNGLIPIPEKPANAMWYERYEESLRTRFCLSPPGKAEAFSLLWVLTPTCKEPLKLNEAPRVDDGMKLHSYYLCYIPIPHFPTVRFIVWKLNLLQTIIEARDFECPGAHRLSRVKKEKVQILQRYFDYAWKTVIHLRRVRSLSYILSST